MTTRVQRRGIRSGDIYMLNTRIIIGRKGTRACHLYSSYLGCLRKTRGDSVRWYWAPRGPLRAVGHLWLYSLIMGVNCTSICTTGLIGWIPITITSVITTKSLLGEIVLSTIRGGLTSAIAIVRHPTSVGAHSRLGYLWVLLM